MGVEGVSRTPHRRRLPSGMRETGRSRAFRAWPSHCSDLGEVSLPPSGPHKVTRPRVKVMHERRGQGDAEGDRAHGEEKEGRRGAAAPRIAAVSKGASRQRWQ